MSNHRPRYKINHEAIQRVSALGVIDPDTGDRRYWQPDEYLDFLLPLIEDPDFDRDRYCGRCHAYDRQMGLLPEEKWLPKRRRSITDYDLNPVNLPWQPSKPSSAIHLRAIHKSRPGRPMTLDACHMCLFSFLDEIEYPPVSAKEKAEWQRLAIRARADYDRIKKACSNPNNPDSHQQHFKRQLERAKVRLKVAIRCCRERGFEPWRWGTKKIDYEEQGTVNND